MTESQGDLPTLCISECDEKICQEKLKASQETFDEVIGIIRRRMMEEFEQSRENEARMFRDTLVEIKRLREDWEKGAYGGEIFPHIFPHAPGGHTFLAGNTFGVSGGDSK